MKKELGFASNVAPLWMFSGRLRHNLRGPQVFDRPAWPVCRKSAGRLKQIHEFMQRPGRNDPDRKNEHDHDQVIASHLPLRLVTVSMTCSVGLFVIS